MSTTGIVNCPRCGGTRVRCTGCGSSYAYAAGIGCMSPACRSIAARAVCRCGRVHDPGT